MIYAKPGLVLDTFFHQQNDKSIVVNFEADTGKNVFNILAIYKHPNQKHSIFESILSDVPKKTPIFTVAIGDFNIDEMKTSGSLAMLHNAMKNNFNITPRLLEETTDYHSSLDHIYSNIPDCSYGVSETYWTDHKALWIAIPPLNP